MIHRTVSVYIGTDWKDRHPFSLGLQGNLDRSWHELEFEALK